MTKPINILGGLLTTSVNELPVGFNKRIKINFDGGDLTGEVGLLLYKEFDAKIGLTGLIQSLVTLNDPV